MRFFLFIVRSAVNNFVTRNAPQYLSNRLMIEDGNGYDRELEYSCDCCDRSFRLLSSLMDHQSSKHGTHNPSPARIVGYAGYDSDSSDYY